MPYINVPEPDEVEGYVKEQLQKMAEATGQVSDTVKILALREDIMKATSKLVETLLISKTELPYIIKERIAILISIENGCSVCVGEHERIARMLGVGEKELEDTLRGVEALDVANPEKKLLKLCIKSAKESYKVMQEDIDELKELGYSDSQLLEAIAIVGYFNYINTIANALGATN